MVAGEGGEKDKMAARTLLTILFTQFSTSWATATAWWDLATGAMASSYRRGLPGQFITYVHGNGVIYFKCLSLAVASASIFMQRRLGCKQPTGGVKVMLIIVTRINKDGYLISIARLARGNRMMHNVCSRTS